MDDTTAIDTTRPSRLRAFYELTKPGIAAYVMITAGVSAVVASHGDVRLLLLLHTVLGTGLATAGALALNQHVERDADAVMTRTRLRPLPTRRLSPHESLGFGTALLVAGLAYLVVACGAWPAGLAAFSALAYVGAYTPLKRRSYMATLVGAVPGALPTLIGWTAAVGRIEPAALALFAIAYLWQLPHVLGLAWMLREDYARVGFRLIPQGGARTIGAHMVVATAVLVPVSAMPTWLGYTGRWYLMGALLASVGFLAVAVAAARHLSDASARRLFFASLVYHPVLLGLMLFDAIRL